MAIVSKENLLSAIRNYIGDRDDDDTLRLIEDVTDTVEDMSAAASQPNDWEQKYKDLDADWRKRYRDRFFNSQESSDGTVIETQPANNETVETTPTDFDDLFRKEA